MIVLRCCRTYMLYTALAKFKEIASDDLETIEFVERLIAFEEAHDSPGLRVEFRQSLRPTPEDAGVLRHAGPRPGGSRPHQPDEDEQGPELLPARHGR